MDELVQYLMRATECNEIVVQRLLVSDLSSCWPRAFFYAFEDFTLVSCCRTRQLMLPE
jgi:hypothetical protein